MQYFKQDDYDEFVCIADKCPQSCCIGWQIVIDKDSIKKYKKMKGEMGKRLKQSIDFKESSFKQNGRRCAMLNECGLCDLQKTCGEEALCYTCDKYPRHVEEFEGVRELSLSLSCPESARKTILRTDKIGFVESEGEGEDDYGDFDYMLYSKLVDARTVIFNIVQNREIPFFLRMQSVLNLSEELQRCVDTNMIFDADEVIEQWQDRSLPKEYDVSSFDVFSIKNLYELETLEEDWIPSVKKCEAFIGDMSHTGIFKLLTEREAIALEQILVLLIFTYYCGAVYDEDIFAKAKLCVASVQWIYEIYKSELAGTGKTEDMDILTKVLYRYAREVEHSDLNLDTLEEIL